MNKNVIQGPPKDIVYSTIGYPKSVYNVELTKIKCPICGQRMEIAQADLSELPGDARNIHLHCSDCGSVLSVIEMDSTVVFGPSYGPDNTGSKAISRK